MPETALAMPSNLSHNVLSLLAAAKTLLTDLATLYLATEVAGQSQATLDAKRRDLDPFPPSTTSSATTTGPRNGSSR